MPDSSADHKHPHTGDELTSYPDAVPPPAVASHPPAGAAVPLPPVGGVPSGAIPAQPYSAAVPVGADPYAPAAAPHPGAVPAQPYAPAAPYPGTMPSPYPAAPYVDPAYQGAPYVPGAPYPGQPGAPAGPRVVPPSVQNAFYLMLAGAVVTLLSLVYSFTILDQTRGEVLDSTGGVVRGSDLDLLMSVTVGFSIVTSLITAGLWVWMAFACRAGKNWARITGTTFFGINVVMFLFGLLTAMLSSGLTLVFLFSGVGIAIGLAVVILLWSGRSKEFFAPVPAGYAPYPGYPATGPW